MNGSSSPEASTEDQKSYPTSAILGKNNLGLLTWISISGNTATVSGCQASESSAIKATFLCVVQVGASFPDDLGSFSLDRQAGSD